MIDKNTLDKAERFGNDLISAIHEEFGDDLSVSVITIIEKKEQ